MLPEKGPRPHVSYDSPDGFLDVTFADTESGGRRERTVRVRFRRREEAGTPFPCPTKILYAKEATLVPPALGAVHHDLIPGSDLVWLEATSPFLEVESPERTVEEILAFDEAKERAA